MPPEPQDATPGPAPSASTPARAPVAPEPARRSAETARLYAMDWKTFTLWCEAAGLAALPAAPATVAGFLAAAGAGTCGAGALGRRAAAIADRHRQLGLPSPAADQAVRAILRAARRAATPRRPPPRRPAQLMRMAATLPRRSRRDSRSRPAAARRRRFFPRAALVGLDAEQLHFTATAVELAIPEARPDGDLLRRVEIPRSATLATCPVRALQDWPRSSDTRFGPVFRKIDRWGTIEHRRLGTDALRRILARRTPRRSRRPGKAAA